MKLPKSIDNALTVAVNFCLRCFCVACVVTMLPIAVFKAWIRDRNFHENHDHRE